MLIALMSVYLGAWEATKRTAEEHSRNTGRQAWSPCPFIVGVGGEPLESVVGPICFAEGARRPIIYSAWLFGWRYDLSAGPEATLPDADGNYPSTILVDADGNPLVD